MATLLNLRDTKRNGIGTFRDMYTAEGPAVATAVTNTTASGTNIQWTETAGGSVIEWISGRVPAGGFTLAGQVTVQVYAKESASTANVGLRVRLYKYSGGVETELGGSPWDQGAEFNSASFGAKVALFTPTSTAFAEDDRLICRLFGTGVGTMQAGQTFSLQYDSSTANSAKSYCQLFETVAFKGETITDSRTETASGTAAQTSVQVATGSRTETASATVSASSIATINATRSESAAASAAATDTVDFVVTITETAAAASSRSVVATIVASRTEAAAAAMAVAAHIAAVASRTETIAATIDAIADTVTPIARALRILVRVDWNHGSVTRVWDGSGPYVDLDGNLWKGAAAFTGLEQLEQAINGEAYTLQVSLSGVARSDTDLAWLSYTNDEIIGSRMRIQLQPCDENDEPIGGPPETRFTGTIDDIVFREEVQGDNPQSVISVSVVNRFTVRRLKSGAVLSDSDQRARAAILDPEATPDTFCERVPLMQDKTIIWPRWN